MMIRKIFIGTRRLINQIMELNKWKIYIEIAIRKEYINEDLDY